ncbi:MAG: D-glucuronyl C5-epimerase family protein [candidate division KSB1 bacterium]|nr:D-glucuronyl C5-epimerase family protein [candidate division KSB1 bacterium]
MALGPYYIQLDSSFGEDFSEYEFSPEGIPMTRFQRRPDWQHNPITVCQYGLFQFNHYLKTGSEQAKQAFLTQADWLLSQAQEGPNQSSVWYYQVEIPFYKLRPPWISGMTQGEALSLLLRAYQLTKDKRYFDVAQNTWKSFSVPVAKGGILSHYPDGSVVIEEYPSRPPSCVLNGTIFALFGVYDYAVTTQDSQALMLFQQSLEGLARNLHRYDTGFWSLYDLWEPARLASRSYHRLHIAQLKALGQLSHQSVFQMTADRWQGYLHSPFCKFRWALNKLSQKVFQKTKFK